MRRPVMVQVLTGPGRFGLFFLGAGLSNIGTWCQNLAAVILVYRLSESVFMVGLVSFAQYLAPLLLAPWTGSVADRFDRRAVIATTQLSGAVLSGALAVATLTDNVTVEVVLGAIFLLGITHAFQSPSQLSLAPLLVPAEQREFALSLNSTQFNVARVVGPVVANVLIVSFGIGEAFVFNTVSFLAYVLAVWFVRPLVPVSRAVRPRMRDTLSVVRATRVVVPLLVVGALISGTTDVMTTLSPVFSVHLVGDDTATGWFISAFGAGAVLTAFLVLPWIQRFRRRLFWIICVQALGLAVLAAAWTLPVALLGMALQGGAFLAGSNRALTIVQTSVPPADLGRVMALWMVAFVGGRPVFALLDGAVAELAGPRSAAALMAAMALVAAGVARWLAARTTREAAERPVQALPVATET
jgi:MFS family permease